MSTGSQPKEQIAACPICVLPRTPHASGTNDAKPAAGHDRPGASAPRILIPVCQADWWWDAGGVVKEVVDAADELAFEAPDRFLVGLASGALFGEVDRSLRVIADLGERQQMEGVIEVAVAAGVQAAAVSPPRRL
jgi:hypothetical protein